MTTPLPNAEIVTRKTQSLAVRTAALARRALTAGLAPMALSALSIAHHPGHGLLLGFTNVREDDAVGLVARLVGVVGG